MKVTILKAPLVELVGKLQSVLPARPAIPILSAVLLEARDDQLILTASDLTMSMRVFVEAKVAQEGSIALPGRRLFQLLRELTTPQVEIESQTPEAALIHAGSSHFKMSGMLPSEFPTLPDLSGGIRLQIHPETFRETLVRSSFAAARDDNRQVLNGILIQKIENATACVGTDGKRLAKLKLNVDLPESQQASYILPLKSVEEMIRLLDKQEKEADLFLFADKIALDVGHITFISKLLSGQYPDVGRVIPKKSASPIALHREELISLLRQISLFTADTSSAVRFSFAPGELHVAAMSGEIGEGKVSMPVNYGGPKFDVAFNPVYFLDILRHCKDETVQLTLTDPFNPGLVTDSTSAQFVLMPMRLDVQS